MSIGYGVDPDDYSPEVIMHRVFTGSSAIEWTECYAELASLGDGPDGDRLRCLFQRLVEGLGGLAQVHDGRLLWPNAQPMTPAEIARTVFWDQDRIEDDLAELAKAGLMVCETLRGRLMMEECRP